MNDLHELDDEELRHVIRTCAEILVDRKVKGGDSAGKSRVAIAAIRSRIPSRSRNEGTQSGYTRTRLGGNVDEPIVLLPAPDTDVEYSKLAALAAEVIDELRGGETDGSRDH